MLQVTLCKEVKSNETKNFHSVYFNFQTQSVVNDLDKLS